jgi:hypothetical protein
MAQHKTLSIKIHSRCSLHPQKAVLGLTGHTQVHWHTDDDKAFALLLPGGVFDGHPSAFAVAVSGSDPAPDPPLKLSGNAMKQHILNYVFDDNGASCVDDAADDPPDIIIDS